MLPLFKYERKANKMVLPYTLGIQDMDMDILYESYAYLQDIRGYYAIGLFGFLTMLFNGCLVILGEDQAFNKFNLFFTTILTMYLSTLISLDNQKCGTYMQGVVSLLCALMLCLSIGNAETDLPTILYSCSFKMLVYLMLVANG